MPFHVICVTTPYVLGTDLQVAGLAEQPRRCTGTDRVRAVLQAEASCRSLAPRELEEFESMRISSYSLRLQPSLMEEAREVARSEGVSLNQLFNVAVAEKLATVRTERGFQERIRRAGRWEPEQTPDRAGIRNPSTEGDKISIARLPLLRATLAHALLVGGKKP